MARISLSLVASAALALPFAFQEVVKPDVTVRGVFEGDGARVEGLGACEITPDRVSCWDMSGAPNADLGAKIASYFTAQYGGDISFRFGQKNRWLVLKRTNRASVTYHFSSGGYGASHTLNSSDGKETIDVIRVTPQSDESNVGIISTLYGLPGPPAIEVPFRKGQKAEYAGIQLEIGSWREAKPGEESGPFGPRFGPGGPKTKSWTVVVGAELPRKGSSPVALTYQALGQDGKPIRYVDLKGEPVSDVKVLSEGGVPNFDPGNQVKPKYVAATFYPGAPSTPGALTIHTNVNPARIATLHVSGTLQKNVLIEGFPMDPNGKAR